MLRICSIALAATALVSSSTSAQPQTDATTAARMRAMEPAQAAYDAMPDTSGSGRYPAQIGTDPSLPDHVIYRPANLAALGARRLGVLVWGNGGCTDDGASARLHLEEVASHGYLVIAPGKILSGPQAAPGHPAPQFMTTTAEDMRQGLDWALAENQRKGSPYHRRIDPAAVAVSGHSCGGILSLQLAADPRIRTVILHNSGVFPNHPQRPTLITDKVMLKGLHTPVLYIVGNASDVAWPVATDDFARIDHVPVMLASLDAGHGGTFQRPNGGAAAKLAVAWLEWRLRRDRQAERLFTGPHCGLCSDPAWKVQRKMIR